jgi:hypothetical protein
MAAIKIKCPKTGRPISTGMEMDRGTFEATAMVGNDVACPHCRERHRWDKKDAYLDEH